LSQADQLLLSACSNAHCLRTLYEKPHWKRLAM